MKTISSLAEATDFLLSYSPPDMSGNYTLERMRQLLRHLGDPQESFRSVHVAGTSGKTSTAYFCRGFLEAAGCKTGLTVSPHIVAINERVQIGGQPLSEGRFLRYLNEFLPLMQESGLQPTYFEILIAFAYWVFAREGVAYAVVETGLGGLLDATNTIIREDKVCVITSIGLDHTEILGATLPLIAEQKAGIIQPGNFALAYAQQQPVMVAFRARAEEQGGVLQEVTNIANPGSLPDFQRPNWAMAVAAYDCLRERDGLPELGAEQLASVESQTPPGRGEIYHVAGKTIILDGAHNPQKIEAILQWLTQQGYESGAVLANFAASPDIKLDDCVEALEVFATHWIVPEFRVGQDIKSRKSFVAERVVERVGGTPVVVIPDIHEALQALLARPEPVLLVTGSLYLVSLLRPDILRLKRK